MKNCMGLQRDKVASIILLTYNGELYLEEVLRSVFNQKTTFGYEVIAIDSGSTDSSVEILRKYPVKIHQISNSEFGHGKTRNLGAKLAAGDYIVYLTQDATPVNENWLENLVSTVARGEGIAGAYSRQLPRPDCNPCERRDIYGGAPPLSIIKKIDFKDNLQKETYEQNMHNFILFSNVSSCIRKKVNSELPFNENILMMEDQEWCKRALESGYKVIYDSASAVYHSHDFSVGKNYRRHFDYGRSLKEFANLKVSFSNILISTFFESLFDFFFILGQPKDLFWKIKWCAKSPLLRFAMKYGFYKGLRH